MPNLKKPILMILGVVICLIMLRLGVWQLDRADQKRAILDQQQMLTAQPAVAINDLFGQLNNVGLGDESIQKQRFRAVTASGEYAADKSIYLDNQVLDGKVGYSLLTPLQLQGSEWWLMVNRGWLAVGDSRASLPPFETATELLKLKGNLNYAAVAPPLWDSDFPVAQGAVWQYLPLDEYAAQMQIKLLPLVLELAPEQPSELETRLIRKPVRLDNSAVAKHQAYAFQWFAMAAAFLLACVILLLKTLKTKD